MEQSRGDVGTVIQQPARIPARNTRKTWRYSRKHLMTDHVFCRDMKGGGAAVTTVAARLHPGGVKSWFPGMRRHT